MANEHRRTLPTVILVGRPNVGKSTLFNRITGSRKAIVTAMAGTTRDLVAERAEWCGVSFRLVDSGGIFGASDDPLQEQVVKRGKQGIASANAIVFLVDAREGLTSADQGVADVVRKTGLPVILAVNKTDDRRGQNRWLEFYQLGFEPVIEIAAEHGIGTGDLLEALVERLPGGRQEAVASGTGRDGGIEELEETAVVIVGRPNVGKSSLVNRLLREERVLVSDQPGTTRDAVDEVLRWRRRQFRIVDTAGIRRSGRVGKGGRVEEVSVIVARRAIERADVAVLLVDAREGLTDQDAAIVGAADRAGCGVIIAANKWDLMKGQGVVSASEFDAEARRKAKFVDYAPLLHISAMTGERLPRLLEAIDRVAAARERRVPTGELNRFFETVTARHAPVSAGRRGVRVLYSAQTGVAPPTFVCFTNVATQFHFSYVRFLTNQLREAFGYEGSPIRLHVRRRRK